jgi:hypothetical protein
VLISARAMATAAAICSAASFAYAQRPTDARPPQNPPVATESIAVQPNVTLTGCLYREEQVPGRKPNIAERAGVLEDYILADATLAPASATTGTSGSAAPVPTTGNMYKINGPDGDQLKKLVGKKVSVTGKIKPEGGARTVTGGGPQPDRGLGPDAISLPDVNASQIAEIAGTCPATPAPLKP